MQQTELVDAAAFPVLPRVGRRGRISLITFEQRDVVAVLGQEHRASQPCDSAAGDHDLSHTHLGSTPLRPADPLR